MCPHTTLECVLLRDLIMQCYSIGGPLSFFLLHVTLVAHAPPAMVFFFLFLFMPLFAAFLLTVYVTLCKPGCAVSAADTSSV